MSVDRIIGLSALVALVLWEMPDLPGLQATAPVLWIMQSLTMALSFCALIETSEVLK